MAKKVSDLVLNLLHRSYFWDIQFRPGRRIPERLIIERVISYGTLDDLKLIINYFGKEVVKDVVKKLNYLDPKTFNFTSEYFHISKKEFNCYTRKQSMPQFWNS